MSKASPRNIPLPALLTHIVLAARVEQSGTASRGNGDHSAALTDLARIIAVTLPARGVLAPGDELCDEIDRVAQRHLHRGEADRQFRAAVDRIDDLADRDAIETAHGRLIEVSEVAHYYAGLAAGITLAGFGRQR
jgi:hypothetical protein